MGVKMNLGTTSLDRKELERRKEENPFARISDIVYQMLEEAILSSELEPDTRLNTAKIAEHLAVSGTPVSTAIQRLADNGLVTETVGDNGKYHNYYVFDITNESLAELFEARSSLEAEVAMICANRAPVIDLSAMEKLAVDFRDAWEECASDPESAVPVAERARLDADFHESLVYATDNKYIIDMYEAIKSSIRYTSIRTAEFITGADQEKGMRLLGAQHLSICKAIRSGYPETARSVMIHHIEYSFRRCLMDRIEKTRKKERK